MANPSIKKGRLIIYRIFDVGLEINLSVVERTAKEGTKRLKFSKYPYMKALEFTNPPVSLDLQGFDKDLFGRATKINVVAKAFDFGVISIAFDVPIPPDTAFSELEGVVKELDQDKAVDGKARQYISQLMESLGSTILSPEVKDFVEDYLIIYIEELGEKVKTPEFLNLYDPTRLLLYEDRDLSGFTRKETLKHSFSYYPDDLIIIYIDNAFIIEPSGSFDIPDILEFANAQIFELRYYDRVIDSELNSIYDELSSKKHLSYFRLREYERLAKKITRTITEITEVTERVNNSLKVTEDIYYARIYRTFMALMRSRDWEVSIREKLQIVMNSYKMLYDEISAKRAYALELGIFILIAIEMLLVIIK